MHGKNQGFYLSSNDFVKNIHLTIDISKNDDILITYNNITSKFASTRHQ